MRLMEEPTICPAVAFLRTKTTHPEMARQQGFLQAVNCLMCLPPAAASECHYRDP